METSRSVLDRLDGGRVLDAATGNGNFIHVLIDQLRSFDKIIGIDIREKGAQAFEQAFAGKAVRFVRMDAARMDFSDGSFETVAISNSLHHMPELDNTLAEMKRVLYPGGNFIISEMTCDGQSETQMTHVLLHHWWAAVDRAEGIHHRETYTRKQILDMVSGLGLTGVIIEESNDLDDDPRKPETINTLKEIVDRYLKRIEGLPGEAALRARGLELRKRVEAVGFHSATNLLIVGKLNKGGLQG